MKMFLKEVAENSESQTYVDVLKGTDKTNALFQWK